MNKDLRARLGATRHLLAQMAGKPEFANVSRIQATAFASMAKSATLRDDERSNLLEMAQDAGFADAEFSVVIDSLSPKDPLPKKQRRQMQDYEAVVEYFDEQEWARTKAAGSTADEVMHTCFMTLAKLGARCPDENTKQLIACLIIVQTEDISKPISKHLKITTLDTVKSAWNRFIRKQTAPLAFVEKLSASPALFESDQPEIFRQAYPSHIECLPVPCQIELTLVHALKNSFGTREKSKSSANSASCVPMLNLQQQSPNGDNMAMFARQMLDHAERQERMFTLLLQEKRPDQGIHGRPRCHSELQDIMVQRPGSRVLQLEGEHPMITRIPMIPSSWSGEDTELPATRDAEHMQLEDLHVFKTIRGGVWG
jgi:hypothetical protein